MGVEDWLSPLRTCRDWTCRDKSVSCSHIDVDQDRFSYIVDFGYHALVVSVKHLQVSTARPTFRSKAFANTILKILCTLIDRAVEQKICESVRTRRPKLTRGACIALENRLACFVISSCSSRESSMKASNFVPINSGIAVYYELRRMSLHLIETSGLTVPLLDTI